MHLELVNILQFIFIFQAAFGAILVWNNRRYRGLLYLSVLLIISMTFNLLEELNITRDYYLVTPIFTLAKGPVFYLFVYRLVYPDRNYTNIQSLHLAPMLLALSLTSWPQVVIALGTLNQFVYASMTWALIFRYHQASATMRSDAESLQLNWAIKVLVVYLILGFIDLVRLNMQPYISLPLNLSGQFFGTLTGLVLFTYLIFKAVRNPKLFNGMEFYLQNFNVKSRQKPETESSSEADSENQILSQIFTQLNQKIEAETLHRQPRLSLNHLAESTGLNIRDISRAINLNSGKNFNDFINQKRIADIKSQLESSEASSSKILDLAFDVGFGSKSTFNAVFKKETGTTPSEYIKSLA